MSSKLHSKSPEQPSKSTTVTESPKKKDEIEDGELPEDTRKNGKDSKDSSEKDSKSKKRRSRSRSRSRSRNRRDDKRKRDSRERGDKDRRGKERRDNGHSDKDRSKDSRDSRDVRKHEDRRRKDSRDRRRSKDRSRDRKRPRSASRRSDKPKEQKTDSKPEVIPITPEQRVEEEEYKKRVEQQLELITEEQNAETEADLRRKRREELLSKFKKTESKQEAVTVENHKPLLTKPETHTNGSHVVDKPKEDKKGFADMFSDSPSKLVVPLQGKVANPNVTDGFDDSEGYYVFRLGDILDSRYRVVASQGRGVFSTVLRVTDTATQNRELVVKVIRNNETMLKAGLKELEFLKDISRKDPEGKKHCVKLISSFEHRNHLCLVFEPMHMNLREVLRKFGGVGLNINAVRTYAKQMFIALKHLKDCGILHGDLKPDNILVNEHMNQIKICDFGSAGRLSECEITPYLVSRFYRAPEIMLGLKYGEMADIWSVGCVLYELYTGKILFSGKDNNEMLKLMMEVKGAFSKKCLRKGEFHSKHFDEDFLFQQKRVDSLTGQELTEKVAILKPTIDLINLLTQANTQGPLSEKDRKKVAQLGDLLLKVFELDPSKRISVVDCLKHPFVKDD